MEQTLTKRERRAFFLGNGNMNKLIYSLTLPSIAAMLINAIYNITDAFFIGKLNDNAAMGAVGISLPLFMMLNALGLAIGIGSASFISRSLGANNRHEANKTVSVGYFTALVLGLITSILILLFIRPILLSIGATNTIIEPAIRYASILVMGSVFTVTNMTLNNLIRAEGNSRYSMVAIIFGALLNILLDYIFIMVLHYGIVGAAVATVIGQGTSNIILLLYYRTKHALLKLNIKEFSFDGLIYSQILKIGLPTLMTQLLMSYSNVLINNSVKAFGDAAISGLVITLRIDQMFFFVLIGYMQGFQPIVGFNYGAKKFKRVKEAIRLSLIYTTIFSIVIAIFYQFFAKDLIGIFTTDPEVLKIGTNQLIGINLLRPFLAFLFIYQGAFQAMGKTIQAAIMALGRQGFFLITTILLLPPFFERYASHLNIFINILPYKIDPWLVGVAYAQTTANFLAIFTTLILAVFITKELNKKIKSHS